MKKMICLSFAALLLTGVSLAQDAAGSTAAQNPQNAGQVPPGTVIPAQLSKSVDTKKVKVGDKIEARTSMDLLSNGKVVLPRDMKIEGHVTSVKAHSKESPDSSVGMAFDRIVMKDGRELSLKASVQAVGAPLNPFARDSSSGPIPTDMQPGGGSARAGGEPGSAGTEQRSSSPTSSPYPTGGPPSGPDPRGSSVSALSASSQGVVGLRDLSLNATPEASVFSSSNKNVHLDDGTQLILKVQ
jgi:hypothetical protein